MAEPLFFPTPWIGRPSDLLGEAPEQPGDVRFAKKLFRRDGRILLLAPLTVDEAEERHREREDYVLVTRLAGGPLLILERVTNWDRRSQRRPWQLVRDALWRPNHAELYLRLYGAPDIAIAYFSGVFDGALPHFTSFRVEGPNGSWKCDLDFRDGERSIHDNRGGKLVHMSTPLTSMDIDLATCPMPAFGEFEDLVRRLRALLQSTGYGGFP